MAKLQLSKLNDMELHFYVSQLQNSYVEIIDDDRLEQWPECFTNDCFYQIISRENTDRGLPVSAMVCDSNAMLVDRIVSLRNANVYAEHFYRHIISNVNVKQRENEVVYVQTNYVVLQTRLNGATEIYNSGHYLDEIVTTEAGFKFRSKKAVFDTYQIQSLMATPI
jgi:anthranilate 1,2-dioxygenase small subunit